MTIDTKKLKSWPFEAVRQSYTWQDAALYALGVGYGHDPLDTRQLRYVYEGRDGAVDATRMELATVPTMAVVLATPGFWPKHPESGIDWVKVLHGEQNLILHRPLPPSATVVSTNRIERIVDKGAGKGALLVQVRDLHDADSGELLATLESITFCRGDGGFSELPGNGPAGGDEAPAAKPRVPERKPDLRCELPSLPQAALIYRLCADLNPLHADPAVATAAGFERPILHGLASYGMAAHAIIKSCCDYDAQRLKSIGLRFSSPVFPGETLITEIWRDGSRVQFQSRVKERDKLVLSNGIAEITV